MWGAIMVSHRGAEPVSGLMQLKQVLCRKPLPAFAANVAAGRFNASAGRTDFGLFHNFVSEAVVFGSFRNEFLQRFHGTYSPPYCSRAPHCPQLSPLPSTFAPQLGQNRGLSSQGEQSTHFRVSALYITSATHLPHRWQRLNSPRASPLQASFRASSSDSACTGFVVQTAAPLAIQKNVNTYAPFSMCRRYAGMVSLDCFKGKPPFTQLHIAAELHYIYPVQNSG